MVLWSKKNTHKKNQSISKTFIKHINPSEAIYPVKNSIEQKRPQASNGAKKVLYNLGQVIKPS